MNSRANLAAAAILAASLGLSGCITLFPKAKPVQLYQFGNHAAAIDKAAAAGAPFNLQRAATVFERAAQSDSILTSSGTESAYLAGARWVAPAVVLFDEAVDRAFNASGPAHLMPRGEMGPAGASLKLDVETFEARYDGSKDAAPTVVVRIHGLLVRASDRSVLGDKIFEVRKPADANRVAAIVHAFDDATAEAVGQIVTWTNAEGAGIAAAH